MTPRLRANCQFWGFQQKLDVRKGKHSELETSVKRSAGDNELELRRKPTAGSTVLGEVLRDQAKTMKIDDY